MRTLLGMGLVLAVACGVASADEKKIDAKKLLGKWEHKEKKFVVEFMKDGKLTFSGGEGKSFDGTYKLDGNKLTLVADVGGKEEKMSRTITKLTDTELTSKDDKDGKEDTLTRVKAKSDK